MSNDDQTEAFKKAVKEWLDELYQEVGRWTVRAVLTAAIAGLVYLAMLSTGWKK